MNHTIEKNEQTQGIRTLTMQFDSVSETRSLYDALSKGKIRLRGNDQFHVKELEFKHEERWTGCNRHSEFMHLLEQGDAQRAHKIERLKTEEIVAKSIRRRKIRADQGDELDMQAMYSGNYSRAWIRTNKSMRQGSGRNLNLIVNIGAGMSTNARALEWRGMGALKVADTLTEAGYNVRIIAGFFGIRSTSEDDRIGYFVTVKEYDEPLDLQKLASVIALPGYFRTIGFSLIYYGAHLLDTVAHHNLGSPNKQLFEETAKRIFAGEGELIFQTSALGESETQDWIKTTLRPFAEV